MVPKNLSDDQKLARKQICSEILKKMQFFNSGHLGRNLAFPIPPGNVSTIHSTEDSISESNESSNFEIKNQNHADVFL
jgi:hypothetical protein